MGIKKSVLNWEKFLVKTKSNMLPIIGIALLVMYALVLMATNRVPVVASDQTNISQTNVESNISSQTESIQNENASVSVSENAKTTTSDIPNETKTQAATTTKQTNCINVNNIYEQSNIVSEGTTGVDKSIDSLKRNDLAASLITLTGVIYGNDIFCMDSISRSKLSETERMGVLGSIEKQIYTMSTDTPQIDVAASLQKDFLPGGNEQSTSAFAAGVSGYSYLKDQLKLDVVWDFFRNVAYVGFIIVLVATGFMIMFRTKLNGQTYVSVMNSIPNIVLGLVLVTFSFAIVGLILDSGKLIMNVTEQSLTPVFQSQGISMVGIQDIGDIYHGAMDIANPNSELEMTMAVAGLAGSEAVLAAVISAEPLLSGGEMIAANIAKGLAATAKYVAIGDIIKILVIGAICLYAAIKVFFTLLVTYLKLFLDLILSPIYILMGSFPGNSHIIKDWFKRLISYVLTFVLVFIILNLSRYIALSSNLTLNNMNFFGTNAGAIGWFVPLNGIIVIVSYLIASTAPSLVNSFMDVKTSQGVTQVMGDVKKSAGKLPVIGGMFGS